MNPEWGSVRTHGRSTVFSKVGIYVCLAYASHDSPVKYYNCSYRSANCNIHSLHTIPSYTLLFYSFLLRPLNISVQYDIENSPYTFSWHIKDTILFAWRKFAPRSFPIMLTSLKPLFAFLISTRWRGCGANLITLTFTTYALIFYFYRPLYPLYICVTMIHRRM